MLLLLILIFIFTLLRQKYNSKLLAQIYIALWVILVVSDLISWILYKKVDYLLLVIYILSIIYYVTYFLIFKKNRGLGGRCMTLFLQKVDIAQAEERCHLT